MNRSVLTYGTAIDTTIVYSLTDMTRPSDPTVLVVDDEPDLANLYTAFLSSSYTVRTATSASEALERVDEDLDVALLDRRMPGISGDELLAKIRERDCSIKVAMLTAVEPDVDIIDMPFDDYKVKPVDQHELTGLVEALLERIAYDSRGQTYFRLASKKAALEMADNDRGEEYQTLLDDLNAVRAEMDEQLDKIGAEAAFKDLPSVS